MVRFTQRYLDYRRVGFNRTDAARFALMLARIRPVGADVRRNGSA